MMGTSVRQHLPFDHHPSFTDLDNSDPAYPFAESAVASGGALRDLGQRQMGVMGLHNGAFRPNGSVTRVSLAYSLVHSRPPQRPHQAFAGEPTACSVGNSLPHARLDR